MKIFIEDKEYKAETIITTSKAIILRGLSVVMDKEEQEGDIDSICMYSKGDVIFASGKGKSVKVSGGNVGIISTGNNLKVNRIDL